MPDVQNSAANPPLAGVILSDIYNLILRKILCH